MDTQKKKFNAELAKQTKALQEKKISIDKFDKLLDGMDKVLHN